MTMRDRDRVVRREPERSGSLGMRVASVLLLAWLAVGLLAAGQRSYFVPGNAVDCAGFGTIALTAVAGPLNYLGVNPKVNACPMPSE